MEDINSLWKKVLSKLELQVTSVSYDLWIAPIEILDFKDEKTLILVASNKTAKNQILKNHLKQIEEAVKLVFSPVAEIVVFSPEEKEEYLQENNARVDLPQKDNDFKSQFNPKYTFDNFVVSSANQAVYAACSTVCLNPGLAINPLFIYGGVGLGKTHLLHSIGNYMLHLHPDLRVRYVTCEKFKNDYIESILSKGEKNKIEFRERYRNVDVLMIDDIQFLAKQESTQEEFFHTFNDLYQNNKQIIISSDRPPKEIATLTERLISRFSSGIIQDIQPPDFEARIAILMHKAQQERYFIDYPVYEFIAERISSNIREMEGMLAKVYFLASLLGKKVATIEDAREAFKEDYSNNKESMTMDSIVDCVCNYFNITKTEIIGKKKSKDIVEPRMIAIYLIYDIQGVPLSAIGEYFGGRDHTTVIHARDKISDDLKTNTNLKRQIADIKNILKIS